MSYFKSNLDTYRKAIQPSLVLVIALLAFGFILFLLDRDVFWPGYWAMIVFYTFFFFLGAFAGAKKGKVEVDELILAGRGMPLWLAMATMSATWIDGGYLNGTAEYTKSMGLAWVQAPWGYALSLIVGGLFFARKMRSYGYRTMLDPLEQKYGKKLTAILAIPALTGEIFWSAAILTALGTTFGTVMGLDFNTAIILSSIITIIYTILGGLWAVAITDFFQLIFIFVAMIIVVPYALPSSGGWEHTWAVYQQHKGLFSSFLPPLDGWKNPEWGWYYWQWWDSAFLLIFGGIAWQAYFQKVLASIDAKTAVRLSIIAGVVCFVAAIPPMILGMVADVTDWTAMGINAPDPPSLTLPFVFRYLTPPIIATLGLGAVAAAVMSSVDSSYLSASSMISWNIYRPLLKPNISDERLGQMIKRLISITGITATLLALKVKSVYQLWFFCSDFVYCILFPQLVCALFFKRANWYGSLAGLLLSFILRFGGGEPLLHLPILLPYPMIKDGAVLFPYKTFAMLAGMLGIIIVSILTQKYEPARPLVKMI